MTGSQDKIMIVNPGSSSLKFRIYQADKILEDENLRAEDAREFRAAVARLHETANKHSCKKFVYRVVYGNFKSPTIIDTRILREISKFRSLDPLHTEKTIYIIKFMMKKVHGKHIACFDSYFHRTMSDVTKNYPLPPALAKKYGIMRYGFHGLAHESLYRDAEELTRKKYKRVISCQLGSGVSLCAIKNGKSIDTTMGFTPLEGLMMETRSGDIDPAIIPFLIQKGFSIGKVKDLLENRSGIWGVSGIKDSKKVIKDRRKNARAKLAFDMFVLDIRKAIGAYFVELGGADLIVLGGGFSRSKEIREKVLEGLGMFGVKIDKNKLKQKPPIKISKGEIDVVVLETDEQKLMYQLAKKFFK